MPVVSTIAQPSILAGRIQRLGTYPFLEIVRAAQQMREQGRDIVPLTMGEPDFGAPPEARSAAIAAIEHGRTGYTAMDGMPELKSAIRSKLLQKNRLDYASDEVTITAGGTQVIFNAMLATLEKGDQVALLAPYFPAYASAVRFAGGECTFADCPPQLRFRPDLSSLRKVITKRTRWLILNSPANPSGAVLTADDLNAIGEIASEHPHLLVLSDDIYETLLFDGATFLNMANVRPDLKNRVLLLNGFSKTFGMTGWRIGYAAGPSWLIEAISQISAVSTFTPSTIAQWAAIAALKVAERDSGTHCRAYQDKRDLLLQALSGAPGMSCVKPAGAFYILPDCRPLLAHPNARRRHVCSDTDLALFALRSHGVAVMPGSAFGLPGFLRLSFAAPNDVLLEGAKRLTAACTELTQP